jgi:hypothetical protein
MNSKSVKGVGQCQMMLEKSDDVEQSRDVRQSQKSQSKLSKVKVSDEVEGVR